MKYWWHYISPNAKGSWKSGRRYKVPWIDGTLLLHHIYDWCDEEIGGINYNVLLGANGTRDFYFKYEEDKVKFILKWL